MESLSTEEELEEISIGSDSDSDESESDDGPVDSTLSRSSSTRTVCSSLRRPSSVQSPPVSTDHSKHSEKLSEGDEGSHSVIFNRTYNSSCSSHLGEKNYRRASTDASMTTSFSFRAEVQCPKVILQRRMSLEVLLGLLYKDSRRRFNLSTDTDSTTDVSHLSDSSQRTMGTLSERDLWAMDKRALAKLIEGIEGDIRYANSKLVRAVKQRAHQVRRQETKCNIITAVLQAMSEKRRVDTKLQFSLDPPATETGYLEWLNAMKAVARLPDGIPCHFRRNLWTTLANHHISLLGIDWESTCRAAFNDKMNPDDDRLSLQIIKDLHRTGWSGLNGEEERIHLKRVLLGYARFNKAIGYCQGFNVIAALLLEVCDYKEELTLKIMIFLIEQVLPRGYFDQTLRALSVDMAVMRDLLHQRLPKTAAHLDNLQKTSESEFEPPVTNVFSMQWFLTLFATCLPKSCVFRIWDALMLDGSEVLLRTALGIWAKLSKRILKTESADEFYSLMGSLCKNVMQMRGLEINNFINIVYMMAEFPYPGIAELRERYTWNIQPLSSTFMLFQKQVSSLLNVSDDEICQESTSCVGCGSDRGVTVQRPDLAALHKQYKLLKQRQKQAAVILQTAYQHGQRRLLASAKANGRDGKDATVHTDAVFNHLCISTADRSFARQPIYVTMTGTVPVASTVVQPLNTDSQRSVGYRNNDTSTPSEKQFQLWKTAANSRNSTILKSSDSNESCNRSSATDHSKKCEEPRSIRMQQSSDQSILEDEDLFLKQFISSRKQDDFTKSVEARRASFLQSPQKGCALSIVREDSYSSSESVQDKHGSLETERKQSATRREEAVEIERMTQLQKKSGDGSEKEFSTKTTKSSDGDERIRALSDRKENGFGGAAELHSQIKSPSNKQSTAVKKSDPCKGGLLSNDVSHSKIKSLAT